MRHAQAARGVPDHRRPLDGRGRRQAASQAGPVSDAVGRIDLAIVSDAARTLQTLAGLKSGGLEVGRVLEERELYVADWRGLIDLLNEHSRGEETALVLGHEPTISLAARMLASGGLSARTDFGFGFSTAMAVAGTVPAWGGVAAGDLRVERVLRPSARCPYSAHGLAAPSSYQLTTDAMRAWTRAAVATRASARLHRPLSASRPAMSSAYCAIAKCPAALIASTSSQSLVRARVISRSRTK